MSQQDSQQGNGKGSGKGSRGPERVVLGTGPDALRAAAVLAHRGARVVLLQTASSATGLAHPHLPLGRGRMQVSAAQRPLVEAILGPLVEAPEAAQGVLRAGKRYRLPMGRVEAGQLLSPEQALHAGRSWAKTRFRNAMAEVIGGGQEERTYRDWVVRRFGEPAWHHLYRPYAERRWGASCDELSVAVARLHHGLERDGEEQVVGGGPAQAHARAEELVRASGEIRVGVEVEALVLDGGRVRAVRTSEGEVPVSGGLVCTAAPDLVAGWLGADAPDGLAVDSERLTLLTHAQVMLRGDVDGLPNALHVLDEDAPFWRVVTPYGLEQGAIFHATFRTREDVPPERELVTRFRDAAERLGIGGFSSEGARVEILGDWSPLWLEGTFSRLRRVVMRWRELGIYGVGRGGAFAPLDPAEEIALADQVATSEDPDLWEIHRQTISPPASLPDLRAHITRFVER